MQTDNAPQLAESALADALGRSHAEASQHLQAGAAAAEHRSHRQPRYVLEGLEGQPLSLYDQQNIEALSFLKLFPTCQNHYGTARGSKVQNTMYARTRLLSADADVKTLTTYHTGSAHCNICKLTESVRIALRWSSGTPTVQQVRDQLQQQRQPDPSDDNAATIGRKLWAFMEEIRGTSAYWRRAAKDLYSMYRSLGTATWLLILRANDMHWDDLAIVLLNAKRQVCPPWPGMQNELHILHSYSATCPVSSAMMSVGCHLYCFVVSS